MDVKAYFKDLDDVARKEAERLWEMKDNLDGVSEATLPIVKQYATTYSLIQKMTNQLNSDDDIPNIDKMIGRLDKMQKMLIQYAKLLKLDRAKENEPKNKFAQFLMRK